MPDVIGWLSVAGPKMQSLPTPRPMFFANWAKFLLQEFINRSI
jgi:hypothetical protein